jgi:IclR family transcriptional regulator, pca regulon regulatory protein
MSPPNESQSLIWGLQILKCFTAARPVLGIADIADDLGMSRSTAHRYVITFVALGYLEQGASRKYRLGLRAIDLGLSALDATGMREQAHPYLDDLCRGSGYTASLAVLNDTEIVYVDRVRSSRHGRDNVNLDLSRGSRLPAYCTAAGKVLLAHLPEDERQERIARIGDFIKYGPNTIASESKLYQELEKVPEAGLAVSNEELAPGLRAIGAPVCGEAGEVVAALGMVASSSMISEKDLIDAVGSHLVSTAGRISAGLGYRPEGER